MKNSTQSYSSTLPQQQCFMFNDKENDHIILYLYYFWKSSLYNHQPSLDESHTKGI